MVVSCVSTGLFEVSGRREMCLDVIKSAATFANVVTHARWLGESLSRSVNVGDSPALTLLPWRGLLEHIAAYITTTTLGCAG